jgi:hypothetical protein
LTEIEILVGRKVEPEFELTVMPDVSWGGKYDSLLVKCWCFKQEDSNHCH